MRLVVKQHRPIRKLLGIAFAVVVLALIVWLSVDYDQWRFIRERMSVTAHRQMLWRDNHELQRENRELRQQMLGLRREHEVDRQSYQALNITLMELQDRIRTLRDEVAFYRGIMSSAGNDSGLRLEGMRFQRMGDTRRYHYTLVLTNLVKRELPVEGRLRITLGGSQRGQARDLDLTSLPGDAGKPLRFKIKHFRLLEGIVELPEGFEPKIVHAEMTRADKGRKKIRQTFDWVAVSN